jgi:hypothetical protein
MKDKKEKVKTNSKKKKKSASSFADLEIDTHKHSVASMDADSDFKKVAKTADGMGSEVKRPITDFSKARRRIQKDSRISSLLAVADDITISPELEHELHTYYTTARDLKLGTYSYMGVDPSFSNPRKNVVAIADAILKIQAFRDRVLDIQLILFDFSNKLQSAKRLAVELIHERYGDELKQRGPLTTQSVFLDAILESLIAKREAVDSYLLRTDKILKNLDNSHFAYDKAGELSNSLILRAEGGSVARH